MGLENHLFLMGSDWGEIQGIFQTGNEILADFSDKEGSLNLSVIQGRHYIMQQKMTKGNRVASINFEVSNRCLAYQRKVVLNEALTYI